MKKQNNIKTVLKIAVEKKSQPNLKKNMIYRSCMLKRNIKMLTDH